MWAPSSYFDGTSSISCNAKTLNLQATPISKSCDCNWIKSFRPSGEGFVSLSRWTDADLLIVDCLWTIFHFSEANLLLCKNHCGSCISRCQHIAAIIECARLHCHHELSFVGQLCSWSLGNWVWGNISSIHKRCVQMDKVRGAGHSHYNVFSANELDLYCTQRDNTRENCEDCSVFT